MEFYRYKLQANDSYGKDYDGEYVKTGFRNVKVVEEVYSLIKETPKGYWIICSEDIPFGGKQKWIPKQSRKRFAYPTKKEALESFIKRQEKKIKILEIQAGDSRVGLFNAQSKLNEL